MGAVFTAVAGVDDIPVKSSKAYEVDGQNVLICHTEMGFFAVRNQCSHQGLKLEGGIIKKCFLFCPHHAARFDLRDGSTKGKLTQESIPTYEVRVADGMLEVRVT